MTALAEMCDGSAETGADTGVAWVPGPTTPPFATPLTGVDRWRRLPGDPARPATITVEGRVRVRGDDPTLRGHFPGLAVFPGVFVIEALGQLVALATGTVPGLREVRSVRFVAPLLDGDELTLSATVTPAGSALWDVRATGLRADGSTASKIQATYGPDHVPARAPVPPAPPGPGLREHHDVRAVLPQRHPLLLVDRVVALDPVLGIATVKAVSGTEPCYAALPDGAPDHCYDYPRSLMIESLGQTAALCWFDGNAPDPSDGRTLMFIGARDYRFEGAVRPGDVLHHVVRLDSVVADTAFASGETWVGDRRVATVATLIATRRPARPSGAAPEGAEHAPVTRQTWKG